MADVFLSVGRAATQKQKQFVERVELLLAREELTVRRAEFSSVSPVKKISEEMSRCSGAVVIAHERLYIPSAIELRGADKETVVNQFKLPTVWNQIESAMAYTLGLPLLVICEKGCRNEGLLENRYDWYVNSIEIEPEQVDSNDFRGIFNDWKRRVLDHKPGRLGRRDVDPARLKISELLDVLTLPQLYSLVIAAITILGIVGGTGFWIGQHVK
jgi:hypothetical protein